MGEAAPIRILTWNLGFAGLGADADFWIDGGRPGLPSAPGSVRRNLRGILSVLNGADADILLLQEVSTGGLLSRGVDIAGALTAGLTGYRTSFQKDVTGPRVLVDPLAPQGLMVASRLPEWRTERVDLGIRPTALVPFVKKTHDAQLTRVMHAGRDWSIANIHLNAYSSRTGRKTSDVARLFARLAPLAERGDPVVIGGDWNLLLSPTVARGTVPQHRLGWAIDFPQRELPAGWSLVETPGAHTNRTNEVPFDPARNFMSTIDGFAVSPGVGRHSAKVIDAGFRYSDHNPVVIEIA